MTATELRELDAAVAREVFGGTEIRDSDGWDHWTWEPPAEWQDFHGAHYSSDCLPLFSTDIAAAWLVVEKMRADDWLISVKSNPDCGAFILEGSRSEYDAPCPDSKVGKGKVVCELQDMRSGKEHRYRHSEWAFADTAPLAIVLASLKAVRAGKEGAAK